MTTLKTKLMDPRVPLALLLPLTLVFSLLALYWTTENDSSHLVVADIEAVMDAQKLVWVQSMKEGRTEAVLQESRQFNAKLQKVLEDVTSHHKVVLDRKAIIYSKEMQDITPDIMNRLNLNTSDVTRLRHELESDFFTDFPAMRKAHP